MELALEIAETRNLNKAKNQIRQGAWIFLQLQALDYSPYLERVDRDLITRCLVETADVNDIPSAPYLGNIAPPSILVGVRGDRGDTGAAGPEGGGVPFSYDNVIQDTAVDSFAVTVSRGVEYQLNIFGTNSSSVASMRTMRIIGGWSEDGTSYGDDGGDGAEIYGDTTNDVSVSVIVSGSTVQLLLQVTGGSWSVTGTRKYIPNNGNGISNPTTLTNNRVWIGNVSNQPVAVTLSGDVTTTNTGVTSITAGSIVNTDISASAAISLSKLEALTVSRAVVSNGSGVLATSATTATQIGYLSTVTSDVQVQLDSKLGAASGAISTVLNTDLTPNRAVIANALGKIAVSGVTATELSYVSGATSNLQTQINALQFPAGVILDYAGTSAPSGFLFCYGQSLSTATYPNLFAAIGYTYGGGGASFTVPDFRGRVSAGKDDMGGSSANRLTSPINGDILGAVGGSQSHTLTRAQLPDEQIPVGVGSGGLFDEYYRGFGQISTTSGFEGYTIDTTGTFDLLTEELGDGDSHNNVQPTIILNKIIKF